MDWQMIGAVGELLGAVAVVATLFYLARQVREGSKEAQRTRWNDVNAEISSVVQSWSENTDLSDIVFRGLTDFDSLQPQEVFRFYATVYPWFRAWEKLFEYHGDGGRAEWWAEGIHGSLLDALGRPGMQKYWRDRCHWFSPAFQATVNRLIEDAQPTMSEAYRISD